MPRCARVSVFNLAQTYYATEELYFPTREFGGAPWENPEGYNKFNPANFVKNWKTPQLVIRSSLSPFALFSVAVRATLSHLETRLANVLTEPLCCRWKQGLQVGRRRRARSFQYVSLNGSCSFRILVFAFCAVETVRVRTTR